MIMKKLGYAFTAAALVGIAALVATPAVAAPRQKDQPKAADKVAVAASTLQLIDCTDKDLVPTANDCDDVSDPESIGSDPPGQTILGPVTIKSSGTTDLLLQVTMECALWTKSPNFESATAKVVVWIELDDELTFSEPIRVKVANIDPDPDPAFPQESVGKVVFCEREQKLEIDPVNNIEVTASLFLRTRAAHGFNWVVLNPVELVGTNDYHIRVQAAVELLAAAAGAEAAAGIGKRTFIIEPVKIGNTAAF